MPLEEYRAKRRFDRTPEPAGESGAGEQSVARPFVVHKHAASRLHYDVRLELDGVLKSWAVPKGPSLDPSQKRLAVEVEDHPLEYASFEGTIPAGEYGGGTVMVWDRGTWEPVGDPHDGYGRGDLKFVLAGEKLNGTFVLVRMKRREGEKRDNWLLIKERDRHVVPLADGDVLERDRSAASGRSMDEIAQPIVPGDAAPGTTIAADMIPGARRADTPTSLTPMLATLVTEAPVGDDWIHEVKLDGYRALARISGDEVTFHTRNGADWTSRFSALVGPVASLGLGDAWLDGEVVSLGPDGRSNFGALVAELPRGGAAAITYAVFDMPYQGGYDLTGAALVDRKTLLAQRLANAPTQVLYVDHVRGNGGEFHAQACEFALEGVVSKRADSGYHPGRSREWRKHKCRGRQEFVVVGYTLPSSGGAGVGALVLATRGPSGALAYSGRVGSGISRTQGVELRARLDSLATGTPPLAQVPPGAARGVRWVRPGIVVEVEFAEWTPSGSLRHPSLVGVRDDKPQSEVRREIAGEVAGVTLTHPDKVLFTTMGATKHDLARHYEAVGDRMLPHLRDRPLVLVRCPHGTGGECFYQKDVSKGFPAGLATVDVDHEDGVVRYALARDVTDIVSLVQLGVLEIHTWGSRADDVETPDRIVIDLDPGPDVPWSSVSDAAFVVRDGLTGLGFVPFVKTTGGKGLHVVVPLTRGGDWGQVREFARAFCERVTEADPARYTINPLKARRSGKVFIDYVRNTRGATAVAPYSTRALPGATVSMPVTWDALESGVRPDAFTIANAASVVASSPDPWADYAASGRAITDAARNALGLL